MPVAWVLDQTVGIKHGFMTTIHAFTGDQRTVDTLHKDPRRARAASVSMIPTSTGAARAVGLVLPELKGKLDGTAVRVPTPNVSLIDLTIEAKKKTTAEAINEAMTKAAKGRLKGVLAAERRSRWSLATSTTARPARPSTSRRPRFWTAPACASCPGTTTSGASPTA